MWFKLHVPTTFASDVRVYPQGSGRLGTTNVHPLTGEFDVDLVMCLYMRKEATTQRELVNQVNGWLGSYTRVRMREGGELAPIAMKEGGGTGSTPTPTGSQSSSSSHTRRFGRQGSVSRPPAGESLLGLL